LSSPTRVLPPSSPTGRVFRAEYKKISAIIDDLEKQKNTLEVKLMNHFDYDGLNYLYYLYFLIDYWKDKYEDLYVKKEG